MMSFTGTGLTCLRSDRVVFQNLNFSVAKNEVLYVKGPNGSGKSSLLRIMAGLLRPINGELYWNGEKLSEIEDDFKGKLHYVGHQNPIKGALSVRENLKFWASIHGSERENNSVVSALESFKLEKFADLPARFLSAGQARRLNLARLNATPAPLWILDEPHNSLDEGASLALDENVARHLDKGGMVVISTHEPILKKTKVLNLSDFALGQSKLEV